MKHIKHINEYNKKSNDDIEPQVGDYIITKDNKNFDNLHNSIGQIIKIDRKQKTWLSKKQVYISIIAKYYELYGHFQSEVNIYLSDENIEYWSKDKEELETILAARKYNL